MSQGENQSIHQAAWEGDLEMLIKCVEEGENPSAVGCNGNTPLHYAAWAGRSEVVKHLIKCGTSVDSPNNRGETPIFSAMNRGQVDTFDLLLRAGANTNTLDRSGRTLLHFVCDRGRTCFAETLIDSGVDKNAQDHNGNTPLMHAIFGCCIDTVTSLLAAGVDKDKTDYQGRTALHIACERGFTSRPIVQILLARGADPNVQNHRGESALHTACATTRTTNLVSILLVNGADVHIRDNEGATPLHMAIRCMFYFRNNTTDIVEMLLRSGADPVAKASNGDTPYGLCLANISRNHRYKVVKSAMIKHLIKLKLAGLPVTTDGIAASDVEAYGNFQYECLQELEKAKKLKVHENFIVGNVFLKHNKPYYCTNVKLLETLEKTMNSPLFLEEFPIYGYMFRLVFKSSKIKYRLLDSALESLKSDTRIKFVRELDDIIKQQILSYLNNVDLKSLIESVLFK